MINMPLAVLLLTLATHQAFGIEFNLVGITSDSACVGYRPNAAAEWGVLHSDRLTAQSAEHLCRTFDPSAKTGGLAPAGLCAVEGLRYDANVDCPYNATSNNDCVASGSTGSSVIFYTFNAAAITCIVPDWKRWSSFSAPTANFSVATTTSGVRSATFSGPIVVTGISPNTDYFPAGSVCLTGAEDNNVAQAMCRSAQQPATASSTLTNGPNADTTTRYLSSIQCVSSSTSTLWNGECTFDTHYYDTAPSCSTNQPQLTCPSTFDIKLSDPIVSTAIDSGFQLVQLRREGSGVYDGSVCLQPSWINGQNFAGAICSELYGTSMHFAAYQPGISSYLYSTSNVYLSAITCPSATDISQCTVSVDHLTSSSKCSQYRGLVSCTINQRNTFFSLSNVTVASQPGKGNLMVSVSVTDQAAAAVCSNGFNQAAVPAACRSIGYTPGPSASFTVLAAPSDYVINGVVCPSGADTLLNCTLQYSGKGYKMAGARSSGCDGQVYLDCDLGAPTIQFRITAGGYLQAQLYANAEWGWVEVASSVPIAAICGNTINDTDPFVPTKTFLTITSCPSNAASYADCTLEYTNGKQATQFYSCTTVLTSTTPVTSVMTGTTPTSATSATSSTMQPTSASTTTQRPSNRGSNTSHNDEGGMSLGTVVGLSLGLLFGIAVVVIGGVCCWRYQKSKDPEDEASATEMGASTQPAALHVPQPEAYRAAPYSPQHHHHQQPAGQPPNNYPNGGTYGQPVMGTVPQPMGDGYGQAGAPYPMGVPASSQPPRPVFSHGGSYEQPAERSNY